MPETLVDILKATVHRRSKTHLRCLGLAHERSHRCSHMHTSCVLQGSDAEDALSDDFDGHRKIRLSHVAFRKQAAQYKTDLRMTKVGAALLSATCGLVPTDSCVMSLPAFVGIYAGSVCER